MRNPTDSFNKFSKVWKSGKYRRKTKIRLFNSNVLAVLLYGCETWKMNKEDEKRLDVFHHKGLRRILKIRWPMRVSNEEVRVRSNTAETISEVIRRRRWKLIGHILRSDDEHTKTALVNLDATCMGRGVEGVRRRLGGERWSERELRWALQRGEVRGRRLVTEQHGEPSSEALLFPGTEGLKSSKSKVFS